MTKVPVTHIDNALIDREAIKTMLARRIPDHTLEQPFYNSEALFRIDMEEIFAKEWIFAGMTCELPKKGSFVTVDIGSVPLLSCATTTMTFAPFTTPADTAARKSVSAPKANRPSWSAPTISGLTT